MKPLSCLIITVFSSLIISGCVTSNAEQYMGTNKNPGIYFEIPVSDMPRAKTFYEVVFGYDFVSENIHGNEMALLPFAQNAKGISGALAKGETYKPSRHGTLIYLQVEDINKTVALALAQGGKELFPRTQANEYGFVAEIEDSEGNRIGLSESKE